MNAAPAALTLRVLRDPPCDGPENMARDDYLLHATGGPRAVLRVYGWSPPTISLGYFQKAERLAELPAPLRRLAIVRRQTGGGAILHDREITYCLILSEELDLARRAPAALYTLVHGCWQAALAAAGIPTELAPDHFPLPTPRTGPFFCFEKPGRTDLLLTGAKVLGSAQRRAGGRVLQHGSLLLEQRFPGHPGVALHEARPTIIAAWIDEFVRLLGASLGGRVQESDWQADELEAVAPRRAHFASDAWTYKY